MLYMNGSDKTFSNILYTSIPQRLNKRTLPTSRHLIRSKWHISHKPRRCRIGPRRYRRINADIILAIDIHIYACIYDGTRTYIEMILFREKKKITWC